MQKIGSVISRQSPITVRIEVDWLASKPKMGRLIAKTWIAIRMPMPDMYKLRAHRSPNSAATDWFSLYEYPRLPCSRAYM
jgi:hypothetical protein